MKYTLGFLLIAATFFNSVSAKTKYSYLASDVDWEKDPKLTELTPEDTGFNAVYIIDENYYEIAFIGELKGQKFENKLPVKFSTYHERVRLNNDEGVEEYNTKYISVRGGKDLVSIKARSINPDGTITELDEDNIKFVENYEGYGPFKIFAHEGVQVGAEIEYIYTVVEPIGDLYGDAYVQYGYPVKKFHYSYTYPEHLIFETKSYNGAPEVKLDTLDEAYRFSISRTNVPAFEEEEMSANTAEKQRIEYKMVENTATGKTGFYNYQEAANDKTKFFYEFAGDKKLNKKETKAFSKVLKALAIPSNASEKDKIYAIEQYVKTNFQVVEASQNVLVHDVFKEKITSEYGAIRLYVLLLDHFDVDHRIVITYNRYKKRFDGDFESYNFLSITDALIYFPGLDLFTSPSAQFYRLGVVPSGFAYTDGLFVKQKEIGGVKAAYPSVDYIEGIDHKHQYDNMYIDVSVADDFDALNIHMKIDKLGYSAAAVRPYLSLLNDEKRNEVLEEEIDVLETDAEVSNVKASNTKMAAYMLDKPLTIEGDLKAPGLLEKAGPKYLVKIGDVIGPQMEMYQDKVRKYDAENFYNRTYYREITFNIPDGYKVVNLDDLNMDVYSEVDGERTMEFKVTYTVEGNTVKIIISEYYSEIRVPLARFEEFRAVVNAAADFNKKVLVLEKL
jgi:hypothetical protein